VTANASSSSVGSLPEALRVDLAAAGLLPPLPRALLAGADRDLIAPLRLLAASRPLAALPSPAGASGGPGSGSPLPGPDSLPASGIGPAAAAGPAFFPGVRLGPAAPAAPALRARAELAAALAASNRSYGHPGADRACQRLADPATRVVIAGQQPGLFGGPLLTFAKLVAAARWAAALEAAGEPAVAVFWVATEDHDYAESSTATVLTADGPRAFDLGPDPEPLVPVGMRALGPAVTEVLRAIAAAVPGERYAEWLRTLARWYQPGARFGEAFCRAVAFMLGARCPLLLDAMHPALKAAQRPWLARLIERRHQLEEALARQDAAVSSRGYELRVSPQRGASPLFLLHRGERRRIEWRGADGFALRGGEERGGQDRGQERGGEGRGAPGGPQPPPDAGRAAELLRIVDENPSAVSPGVLARPAIADAVLGTTLQLLGPGELSYMAQAAAVYPVLEIEAPWVAVRPQALVLDAAKVQWLEEMGLPLADLLGDRARLDRILAERAGGDFVTPVRERLAAVLDELRAPALAADPNLERPLAKTREQVLRAIELFADKALPALARRDEQQSRRIETLRQLCLPGGKLQERVVCAAHFQGKYGDRLADAFWEQLELDPATLAVIVP
jgi:bacillithiol synthase